MWSLLVIFLLFTHNLCEKLEETVALIDDEIVRAITNPDSSDGGSIRKKVLRLELTLGEIGERVKDGDEEGLNAVDNLIKNGGLKLSTVDYVNDTLLMNKFNWSKNKCEELKYNLQQICSTWLALEGGIKPTTMIYIGGRNKTRGLQYMEKYM